VAFGPEGIDDFAISLAYPGSAVDAYGLAVSTLIAVIAEWAVVAPWLKKQPVRSCAELVR
jgi:peptidoglycan biosynthesis protein MviN/MurJ (putative lipid II flippase)